ncbi:glycosyltransferase family 4 protein [Thiolapillus brandeum]|nr:glycosyltransferase family 4 protein [Thiolapillus brandeum]
MKIIFFANTDWYLYNFRLGLAHYLSNQGVEVVMMSPPGDYGAQLEEQGFRWIPLPMERRSLNPLAEWKLLRFIRSVFRAEQPDAVHSFTIKSVVYGGLAAQSAGIPNRIHAVTGLGHVFVSNTPRARLLRPLVKRLLKLALRGSRSRLILQNPDDRQLFIDLKLINPNHIHLVKSSGVDTEVFVPTRHKRGKRFRVLLAARLLWEKGIREYAYAAQKLAIHAEKIEFLLAGATDPGNPSAVEENDIRIWQSSGLIKVLGHVDDLQYLMREVDLMVLPSHREGVPRGLIEAAAMGLPIVTTDAPGCREVVDDGVNGLLVPVGDGDALAHAIEYLLNNPDKCREFGAAGRKKVLREFDQKIVFALTGEVYRELGLLP